VWQNVSLIGKSKIKTGCVCSVCTRPLNGAEGDAVKVTVCKSCAGRLDREIAIARKDARDARRARGAIDLSPNQMEDTKRMRTP
jgi:hypothetical protein